MTAIEESLFRDGTAHWVSSFKVAGDTVSIILHPCKHEDLRTSAKFTRAKVLSVDVSYADGGHEFPWDIIGFDSEALGQGRWYYCLHTDAGEYCFEADWPAVEFLSMPNTSSKKA